MRLMQITDFGLAANIPQGQSLRLQKSPLCGGESTGGEEINRRVACLESAAKARSHI